MSTFGRLVRQNAITCVARSRTFRQHNVTTCCHRDGHQYLRYKRSGDFCAFPATGLTLTSTEQANSFVIIRSCCGWLVRRMKRTVEPVEVHRSLAGLLALPASIHRTRTAAIVVSCVSIGTKQWNIATTSNQHLTRVYRQVMILDVIFPINATTNRFP